MAVWTNASQNDLPDSCFAYIEPGGSKDETGKTTPRSLRHFPYKDASGKLDPAHVRNALARIPQSTLSAEAKGSALAKIKRAASSLGIGNYSEQYLLAENKPVMVFPIGKFRTRDYPKLNLDRAFADQIIEHFDSKVLGATEPFIDASGKHDYAAPAGGWVKKLFIAPWEGGEALWADPDWTSEGKRVIGEKLYRYISPSITKHTIPETGEEIYPVLHSMSLTNTPVLRMMPPVSLAEMVNGEIKCSELDPVFEDESIELDEGDGEPPEPTQAIAPEVTEPSAPEDKADDEVDIDGLVSEMNDYMTRIERIIKGQRGAPAVRNFMREAMAKVKAQKIAASEETRAAMETMLTDLQLRKEMNMQKLVERFELNEDATEDDVLSAIDSQVTKLTEEKSGLETQLSETKTKLEAAEAQLAEIEKEKRDADIEHQLSEAVTALKVTPAEVGDAETPGWVRELAFSNPDVFAKMVEQRQPQVDLSENGSGENLEPKGQDKAPDVAIRDAARKLMSEEKLDLAEAYRQARIRNPELAEEYKQWQAEVTVAKA
jgi:hypothetical protein